MNSRVFTYRFIIDATKNLTKGGNSLIKGMRGWFK